MGTTLSSMLTVRELHKEFQSINEVLSGSVRDGNPLADLMVVTAGVLDALAIRYEGKSLEEVCDALYDEAHDEWEKSEKAKEALKNDSAH